MSLICDVTKCGMMYFFNNTIVSEKKSDDSLIRFPPSSLAVISLNGIAFFAGPAGQIPEFLGPAGHDSLNSRAPAGQTPHNMKCEVTRIPDFPGASQARAHQHNVQLGICLFA